MARAPEQPDIREELRILTTHIETINQQLASGGAGGGGNDPALQTRLAAVEQKINYLYELVKGIETQLSESVKSSFEQVGAHVTKALNSNLTQLYAQMERVGHGAGGESSGDVLEIKKSMKQLIDVYKDEVAVFKEQNAFLQRKLLEIEKKIK